MSTTVNVHRVKSVKAEDYSDHGPHGFCTLDFTAEGVGFSFFFRTEDLALVRAAAALLDGSPSVLKQKEEKTD